MRRVLRILGTLMILGGVATLAWAVLVWQWQDPFTALYTWREQNRLEQRYEARTEQFRLPSAHKASIPAAELLATARRYRHAVARGEPVGLLTIGSLGLRKVVVNGTDHDSLMKGPGRDLRTYMPGQGELVYIAGHRTTYGAPFGHIDGIEPGDYVTLDVPYAKFTYRVTKHVVVGAGDVERLRSQHKEQLVLQACHPRFFATHRYLVYAELIGVAAHTASGGSAATALAKAA